MCAPSPPDPPNFAAAATAQGAANVDAARAAAHLNNPNVVSPLGTQTVTYNGDDPTITQKYSPSQQALFDQSNAVKAKLAGLGTQGATALQGLVGKPLDITGALGSPQLGSQKVIDALMSRYDTQSKISRDDANSSLIAAGIRPGTTAYEAKMDEFNRARNDALNQATGTADQQAQQQRQQAISELLANRQTPLNEVTALMSGSQVSNPFAIPGYAQNSNVSPAPVFAGTQAGYQGQLNNYNAQAGQYGNMMSGLFGLGKAAILA